MFLLLFSTSITIQIHLYFDMNLNSLQQTIYTDVMYDVYFVFIEFPKMFTTRIICTCIIGFLLIVTITPFTLLVKKN